MNNIDVEWAKAETLQRTLITARTRAHLKSTHRDAVAYLSPARRSLTITEERIHRDTYQHPVLTRR